MLVQMFTTGAVWATLNSIAWPIAVFGMTFVQLLYVAYVPQKLIDDALEMQKNVFELWNHSSKVCVVDFLMN